MHDDRLSMLNKACYTTVDKLSSTRGVEETNQVSASSNLDYIRTLTGLLVQQSLYLVGLMPSDRMSENASSSVLLNT